METIMEYLQVTKPHNSKEAANVLREAGFVRAANLASSEYQIITPINIHTYLQNRALAVAKAWRRSRLAGYTHRWSYETGLTSDMMHAKVRCRTGSIWVNREACDFEAKWNETPIDMYPGVPPKHVLNRVQEAKKDFKHFAIVTVTVEEVPIPDPLVVGIKDGCDDRFLIDWWDKDIDPLELLQGTH